LYAAFQVCLQHFLMRVPLLNTSMPKRASCTTHKRSSLFNHLTYVQHVCRCLCVYVCHVAADSDCCDGALFIFISCPSQQYVIVMDFDPLSQMLAGEPPSCTSPKVCRGWRPVKGPAQCRRAFDREVSSTDGHPATAAVPGVLAQQRHHTQVHKMASMLLPAKLGWLHLFCLIARCKL
jgi:hypothetical protein